MGEAMYDSTLSTGLTHAARAVSTEEAKGIVRSHFGIEADPVRLGGEKDANFRIQADGKRYLLKIIAGEDPAVVNMHTHAMLHVERKDPKLPIQRVVCSLEGKPEAVLDFGPGDKRMVRLVTYVDGAMQRSTKQTPKQRFNAGAMLARLQLALWDFRHPAESHKLTWDMAHAADLVSPASDLADGRRLAEALQRFREGVLSRIGDLPQQACHNDLNSDNIVVDPVATDRVTGLLDFGDMVRTARIFDVAIGAAYQATDADDPLGACADFIKGFVSHSRLGQLEREVLFDTILARMAMRIAITELRAALFPENSSYILRNTPQVRLQFDRLYQLPVEAVQQTMNSIFQPMGSH